MIDRSISILRYVLGAILILGVLLNCTNTTLRWFWGSNVVWAEEVMSYGMIVIIMMGTVIVASTDSHLRMDAITSHLPDTVQQWLKILSQLLLAAMSAYLAIQSWTVVSMMFRMGQASIAARLPMWIPHSAFFVAFILCTVVALLVAVRTFRTLLAGRPQLLPSASK